MQYHENVNEYPNPHSAARPARHRNVCVAHHQNPFVADLFYLFVGVELGELVAELSGELTGAGESDAGFIFCTSLTTLSLSERIFA